MPAVANLIHETSQTTGTGNLTIAAVNGRQRFSGPFALSGSDTFDYFISSQSAAEWERGTGSLVDANTLKRDTVLENSNGDTSPVSFSSGAKDVMNDVPAVSQVQISLTQTLSNKTLTTLNSGQLAGHRNLIINGDMSVSQRGTGFTAPANTDYTLDRWTYGQVGVVVVDVNQVTTPLPNGNFTHALQIDVTTGDASIGGSDLCLIQQKIEAFNTTALGLGSSDAKTITVSFWVRGERTGTYCVGLNNSAGDRSYVVDYTINVTDTWEYKTATITLDTAGTWVTGTNGIGLALFFTFMSGPNFQGTGDQWNAALDFATGNITNGVAGTTDEFFLTGVQLEIGSQATPFEHRLYGTELALCQRYAVVFAPGITGASLGVGFMVTTTICDATYELPVEMRATPTLTFGTATDWGLATTGNNDAATAVGAGQQILTSSKAAVYRITIGSARTAGDGAAARDSTGAATVTISAEL